MKKLFRTVLAVAVAATAMTSCQKSMMEEEGGISAVVSFNASFPETKTTFGTAEAGKYPVLWQDGDKVAVSVSLTSPLKDLEVTPSTDKKTATFSKDVTLPGEGPWAFYVMSPSAAMVNASSSYKSLTVDFATDQTPTAVSVDPAAQVLLAMATATTIPTEPVPVTFDHLAAYGKVSLTNLPTTAKVTGMSLSFDQPVTGRWFYYPAEEDVTKKFTENSTAKMVNLTTDKTENVFFAVAPNGVAVKSLKVTLFTEDGNFEKEVTVPEKTFKSGVVSTFTVDMTGAVKPADKVFKLVKNVANLAAGDQVIITNKAASKAISTNQASNNRKAAAVTPNTDGDIVNPSEAVQVLTLATGATTGTFAFMPEDGKYLYAVKGSNHLKTKDALEADGSFTVTIAEDGEATILCAFEGENRLIMYNSSSDLFSCYKSGQTAVAIYKQEASAPKEDVVKWVPSAAGNEVFANGEGDATIEPTTATWLTWNKETKTVAWTEADKPRQAKLTFANGSTYDLTQIDAKIMAGKWALSGDIRTGANKGTVAKATASSTSGATYGSKGGVMKDSWYDDGWTVPAKVTGGVELPVTVTYNAEGEDPGKYLNPTATGTSADRAKAQKNNLVLTGLYENLTMPARAEVNYEEKWARLYLVIENKNQQLTSGVYSGEYASFQTELQKPNGDWELGYANGGVNYYLGELTVAGDVTKASYAASQTCVYYPTFNMVGILVNRFATQASTAGTELVRSTKSVWTKTHITYSGSAYARAFQNALSFEMKEAAGPEPEPEPTTVEEVLTKAGKNPSDYEKLPFWYNKNKYYQSNSNNKTALMTGTGSLENKFVATNIVSKGEIPNGSVVVTMGGSFGYRPEGWVSGAKTTTRPDRTSVQVTEVDDAWWVVGSQNFNQRAFNLDMNKAGLTDAEMDEVIEKFAVFVPKPTVAKPDPDAVFTANGYTLSDYKKVELTYTPYAFYHSTDANNGGKLIDKTVSPTATNLGQFVATGYLTKEQIPNGSVLVVCDGYQYRPEGWQVQGEKNTGSRPGNVTTAVTVVDDAWWSDFTVRAFNLAYKSNPGIPVTEMDHVKASFAIYVPVAKTLTIERVWGKYSTAEASWNSYYGGAAGGERNVTMDADYIYIPETGTKKLWAISVADPTNVKAVDVSTVTDAGTFKISCPRVLKNTDASINGGKDVLVVSNMIAGDPTLYFYLNGIDAAPTVIKANTWATRRLGDTFTYVGTLQDGVFFFKDFDSAAGTVTFPMKFKTTTTQVNLSARLVAPTVTGAGAYFPYPDNWAKGVCSVRGGGNAQLVTTTADFKTAEGAITPTLEDLSGYYKDAAFRFFEFNGKRYVAYTRQVSGSDGRLFVIEGAKTDGWDTIIKTRKVVYYAAIQNSKENDPEPGDSPKASGNSGMDLDIYEVDGAVNIAVVKQNVGLSLFKMYMK